MRKHSASIILVAVICLTVAPASRASDNKENKEWQDQETWTQFTEKERLNAFKMASPKAAPSRPPTVLESVLAGRQPSLVSDSTVFSAPSASSAGNFTVPAYICMPGQTPAAQQPIQHIETVVSPVIRRNAVPYPPFGFGPPSYGWGGWGGRRFWGNGFWGQPIIGFQKTSRVIQTGPSKASGNFYMPSTPDPSASGNYYASPTAPPVAMPIINKEPDPKDFWGRTGSPLPTDQQTQ